MLERALKLALKRKDDLERDALLHPPKTMEELQFRVGQHTECCAWIRDIEDILRGKEDE